LGGAALAKMMGAMFFTVVGSAGCLITVSRVIEIFLVEDLPCFHSWTMYLDGQMVQSSCLLVYRLQFD
jgi:hypothetical protein